MDNDYYISFIKGCDKLQDITKKDYIRYLKKLLDYFKEYDLHYIVHHPDEMDPRLSEFFSILKGNKDNKGNRDNIAIATRIKYIKAVMSLFRCNQTLYDDGVLYGKWNEIFLRLYTVVEKHYKSNTPNERQITGYVSFDELLRVRDTLPIGDQRRVLISMYTEIPPVRNDYWNLRIYNEDPNDDNNNYMIIRGDNNPIIVLQKYKTSKKYGKLVINLNDKLSKEIRDSLVKDLRTYLFTTTKGYKYKTSSEFGIWANGVLKELFGPGFNLTMFRYIYISRRDLCLEKKSIAEQEMIAKIMGHSINMQHQYMWHCWDGVK